MNLISFSFLGTPSTSAVKKLRDVLSDSKSPSGFLKPPDATECRRIASYAAKNPVTDYCVAGIGGSALPLRSLLSFFRFHKSSKKAPKIWILDTTDPDTLEEAFQALGAPSCKPLFHIVSKSGKTLEVELIRRRLEALQQKKEPKDWKKRFVVTATPGDDNPLERWAARNRIARLDLAEDIGGRFSSFSPVCYLGGAYWGLDLNAISKGAKEAGKDLETPVRYAELLASELKRGRKIAGFFLYGDEFDSVGDLLLQLFAESLGKSGKGLTPVKFIGPRDQHSLLQLYLDGPRDKTVTLLSCAKETQSEAGAAFWAAQEGVMASLKRRGVPAWRIGIAQRNEEAYGRLIQFFHLSVTALSSLLGVNPFDQPMVELQKKLTLQFLEKKI